MIKKFLSTFLVFFYAFSTEVSLELELLYQEVLNDAKLNQYLSEFPEIFYKIYEVPKLGKFYVDSIPDAIKGHLRKGIYWESGIGECIRKHTKPNTIAIDLGAHIGIHTITMSKQVGPNGLVISFEPQSKIYRELRNNILLNECSHNVIPLPLAVGECEQMIEMCKPNLFNEGGIQIGSGGNTAKMITLDSLNLNNVSCIKMDVESYELKVLHGSIETLKRNKPVIVFEILGGVDLKHPNRLETRKVKEIFNFLEREGYQVNLIHGNDFVATPNIL